MNWYTLLFGYSKYNFSRCILFLDAIFFCLLFLSCEVDGLFQISNKNPIINLIDLSAHFIAFISYNICIIWLLQLLLVRNRVGMHQQTKAFCGARDFAKTHLSDFHQFLFYAWKWSKNEFTFPRCNVDNGKTECCLESLLESDCNQIFPTMVQPS